MKLFASALFLAAFALATPGRAQDRPADDMNSISGIRRPTPAVGTEGTAQPTGPLEAKLSKDAKGSGAATTFAPGDTVYLVCKNVSGKKGDKLAVSWYGGAKDKKLTGSESALPSTGVYNPSYNLPPAKGGSPAGEYHVDFSMNSKVVKTLKFTVK